MCKLADRLYQTNIRDDVPRVPPTQLRTLTATEPEFLALLRHAKPWMKAFLLLARSLGLRNIEARSIRPGDIQHDAGTLFFSRKQEGDSNLPLTPELAAIFARHANKPDTPLLECIAKRPVSHDMVGREWIRIRKLAGVNPRLTPHDLRRTVCKRVYDATKDLRLCQQLLGHRSLQSTLRYVGAFDRTQLRQHILAAAPNLNDLPLGSERTQ